jgi:branched-chain amino acid transport system permease protein
MSLFGQLIFDGLAMGLVYVVLAAGLVIITSVNQILFFAYGQFFTVGAYTAWYATAKLHFPFFAALIFSVIVTAVLGILSYILIFKRIQFTEGKFLATLIASMGLSLVIGQGGLLVWGTSPRSMPDIFPEVLSVFGLRIVLAKVVLIALGVVVTLLLFWIYEKTNIGRGMRAVSFNPSIASLHGVSPNTIYMLTLGLGTGLAAFSGGVIAPTYNISIGMGQNVLWSVMLMMMLGGMDSLVGAVLGGIVVGQILSFGQYYLGGVVQIVLFVIIGIVLYFRPQGLLGRGLDIGV